MQWYHSALLTYTVNTPDHTLPCCQFGIFVWSCAACCSCCCCCKRRRSRLPMALVCCALLPLMRFKARVSTSPGCAWQDKNKHALICDKTSVMTTAATDALWRENAWAPCLGCAWRKNNKLSHMTKHQYWRRLLPLTRFGESTREHLALAVHGVIKISVLDMWCNIYLICDAIYINMWCKIYLY